MKNKEIIVLPIILFISIVLSLIIFFYLINYMNKEREKTIKIAKEHSIEIIIDHTTYNLAVEHIKDYEKYRAEPYTLNGRSYIGYGHLLYPTDTITYLTEEKATELLKQDLFSKIKFVNRQYGVVGNEALALGMLIYNVKYSSIRKSRLHKELTSLNPDKDIIKDSWLSFCVFQGKEHKGLKARREFEVEIFKTK